MALTTHDRDSTIVKFSLGHKHIQKDKNGGKKAKVARGGRGYSRSHHIKFWRFREVLNSHYKKFANCKFIIMTGI